MVNPNAMCATRRNRISTYISRQTAEILRHAAGKVRVGFNAEKAKRRRRRGCGAGRYRAEAGKLPGRASRGCVVADATLKRASCGVIPVARPSAAPGRLGNRLRRSRKFLEVQEVDNFPSFPMLRSSFPNPEGEAEGLARTWDGGRNAVSVRRDMAAQDARAHLPAGFPKSAR